MHRLYLLFLGLAACAAAADVTVYRSVDHDGAVSFSDRPPMDAQSLPIRIEADDPPPSPEVAERREAIREVTEQMQADRHEREQERALAAAAAAEPQAPDYAPEHYDDPDYIPIYYPYAPRRPWWADQPRPNPPAPPRPNPHSASPRGLVERIRANR